MDVGGHCGDMAVRSVVVGVAGGGWDGENHHAPKERVDVCEAHDAGYVHRLKTAKEEDRVGGADEYVTKTPALDMCRIVSSGVASQYIYHGCVSAVIKTGLGFPLAYPCELYQCLRPTTFQCHLKAAERGRRTDLRCCV